MNEFNTVTDTKLIYRNILFLCSNNKLPEGEIKQKNPINNCIKTNKTLRNKSNQGGIRLRKL